VFVANNWDDTVTMLDARSGMVLRTITVGPNPARVVVDEHTARVFVVHGRADPGNNPNLELAPYVGISTTGTTILDARSGAVLGQLAVGGSPVDDVGLVNAQTAAVDERHGRVFVIDATSAATLNSSVRGSVGVLDARSGRVLHTLTVGRHPIALAVDEATARLFVVNTNSGCIEADPWRWIPAPVRHLLPLISQPPRSMCGMQGTVTVVDTSRL
jgi:YVTN family beta-propeller protein